MNLPGHILLQLFGGCLLGLAWTIVAAEYYFAAAILTLISVLIFICSFRPAKGFASYLPAYCFGIASHLIAFSWLIRTIRDFGNFPESASYLIFFLFVLSYALVFPLAALLHNTLLPETLKRLALAKALSWAIVLSLFPRIFPWDFSHTLFGFSYLIQASDLLGAAGLSFFVIVGLDLLQRSFSRLPGMSAALHFLLAAAVFSALLIYGQQRISGITKVIANSDRLVKVSIVQTRPKIETNGAVTFLAGDLRNLYRMSRNSQSEFSPHLVIWPESSLVREVSRTETSTLNLSHFPKLPGAHFLTGSLSHSGIGAEKNHQNFSVVNRRGLANSAILVNPDGRINQFYQKQILMPFGEYIPFARQFPFLYRFAPYIPDFVAGKATVTMNTEKFRLSPLICYEDLIPALSRTAKNQGAELLINLTNDAWFGTSAAPAQHDLIARFRALENRIYLLRSTTTGISSITSPTGQNIASSQLMRNQTLEAELPLADLKAPYSALATNVSFWWLSLGYVIFAVIFALVDRLLAYLNVKKHASN